MSDSHMQENSTADESPAMQLPREIAQQQIEMQVALQQQHEQHHTDLLAALHN